MTQQEQEPKTAAVWLLNERKEWIPLIVDLGQAPKIPKPEATDSFVAGDYVASFPISPWALFGA